jgi:hypothetical protein
MRHSKAAMRVRHLQLAHMTVVNVAPREVDEEAQTKPRTYSTERYVKAAAQTNGIPIPQHLREQIEKAATKTQTPQEQPNCFNRWGFFLS